MRKKICVIMSGLNSEFNHKTMEGISNQANALDYDVFVYSFFDNYYKSEATTHGEENLLNLVRSDVFDGFIVRKGSFHRTQTSEKIARICAASGRPWVDLDDEDTEESVYPLWNDRENFRRLVEHLITEHGYRKIYCITGVQGFHQSENRLNGYRDALRARGIPLNENYEFYGDFWKQYAEDFADKLADGTIEMPEAIAFAGTVSANSLVHRLEQHGIHVPEDLAVVGYDCCLEGILASPTMTCISNTNYNQGIHAVCRLHHQISGEKAKNIAVYEEAVQAGESCGCRTKESSAFRWYKNELSEQFVYRDMFQSSNMQQSISSAEDSDGFFSRLIHFDYLIRGIDTVWFCLCNDWDGINNIETDEYRKDSYSEQLFIYTHAHMQDTAYNIIDRNSLLSHITNEDKPSTYYFIPLHYEDRCFGCLCLEYKKTQYCPDSFLRTWIEIVNNALETIRIRYYIRRFSSRIHLAASRDPLTGIYNRRGFEELSAETYEHATIHKECFLLVAIKLYNLEEINQICGYKEGERLIVTMAEAVNLSCKGDEVCCRGNSDTFYIVGSHDESYSGRLSHAKKILEYCGKHLEKIESKIHIQINIETYFESPDTEYPLERVLSELENRMDKKHLNAQKKMTHLKNMVDLRRMIYENPGKKWTIDEMTRIMMLSRAYFQRMYKQNFGVSATADVIAARIELAKKLLIENKRSLYEISELCGYNSDIYFMQQFKRETGMTPTEFQNTHT